MHSSIAGHLDGFHISAIVNHATVITGVQLYVWDPDFNSFGQTPRSGLAGSYVVPF